MPRHKSGIADVSSLPALTESVSSAQRPSTCIATGHSLLRQPFEQKRTVATPSARARSPYNTRSLWYSQSEASLKRGNNFRQSQAPFLRLPHAVAQDLATSAMNRATSSASSRAVLRVDTLNGVHFLDKVRRLNSHKSLAFAATDYGFCGLPRIQNRLRSWQTHDKEYLLDGSLSPRDIHGGHESARGSASGLSDLSASHSTEFSDDGMESDRDTICSLESNPAANRRCTSGQERRPSVAHRRVSVSIQRTRRSKRITEGAGFLGEVGKLQATKVFRQVAASREEVHSDERVLVEAFVLGGYPYSVRRDWLVELVEREVFGRSVLDLEDFLVIWDAYGERLAAEREKLFHKFAGNHGAVKVAQLPDLMVECGVPPMPGALAEMLQTVLPGLRGPSAAEVCQTAEVGFTTFDRITNELYQRAGLTLKEEKLMTEMFDRLKDSDGLVSTADFDGLLQWHDILVGDLMGLVPIGVIDGLIKELVSQVSSQWNLTLDLETWKTGVDLRFKRARNNVRVNIHGFLAVSRALHQYIWSATLETMASLGLDEHKNALRQEDISALFDEFGSVSSDLNQVIADCKEELGLQGFSTLRCADVYSVLLAFCRAGGLSKAEQESIATLFEVFTKNLKDVALTVPDRVPTSELPRLLRWLCYCPSQHRLFDFMEKYNHTEDELDLSGLKNVCAEYRMANIGMARAAFRKEAGDLAPITRYIPTTVIGRHSIAIPPAPPPRIGTGPRKVGSWHRLKVDEIARLMHMVGHAVSNEDCERLKEEAHIEHGTIDWREFLRLEACYRSFLKDILKENLGFNLQERAELQADFEANLKKSKKGLLFNGLRKIVSKRHPEFIVDQLRLRKLVEESDSNDNGVIEFKEYLWVMRRLRDKQFLDIMKAAYQLRAKFDCGKDEVWTIRELFHFADTDMSGYIDFDELETLFSGLVSMCAEAKMELAAYFKKVKASENHGGASRNQDKETLDFWEFLSFFKDIQAHNWRNINGVTRGLQSINRVNNHNAPVGHDEARKLLHSPLGLALL